MTSSAMHRRDFLRTLGVGAAALTGQAGLRAAAKPAGKIGRPPNVVLVMTDDQGYGDVAALGNKMIKTPAMDKLHGESVRLTDFHVAPTCAPTRAGLMTGRSCNRTGVWHTIMGRSLLRRDEVTMADAFAAGGYRTGFFGKWHLGDNYPFRPGDRGFGEVLRHGGGGVVQLPDYWGNDYFGDTYWHNEVPKKYEGYCTDEWFNGALRFIEANKDRPFFAYIPTNAPHGPLLVAEKYEKMYTDDPRVPSAKFYGMITNIDENMVRLDKKLHQLGLAENTIYIFMTDNGTAGGMSGNKGFNAGMRGKKGSEYEGGHRVPCFIRWPAGGLTGGKDVTHLTANVDLLPTLIELCGLPALKGVKFDGTSIAPLLHGTAKSWPDRVLITDSQRMELLKKWHKSAVMTDRWRLVNQTELYDIKADPGQAKNIADQHPDVVKRLQAEYEKWWTGISARGGEYCNIILGSDQENPSRLTSHDWHTGGSMVPWNQGQVRAGAGGNGFWAVEIDRDGTYEFALRRWPEELDAPITAAIEGGRAIPVTRARIQVGGVEQSKAVSKTDTAAVFRLKLKAGATRLQTWFLNEGPAPAAPAPAKKPKKGKKPGPAPRERGAYFVYVKRL